MLLAVSLPDDARCRVRRLTLFRPVLIGVAYQQTELLRREDLDVVDGDDGREAFLESLDLLGDARAECKVQDEVEIVLEIMVIDVDVGTPGLATSVVPRPHVLQKTHCQLEAVARQGEVE